MTIKKLFANCIFILLTISSLSAQRGFDLSLVAGLNASQIAGDQLAGFDKLGINSGLKIGYRIKSKMDLNFEMLFSQKGSIAKRRYVAPGGNRMNTTLSYLDFPLYITYNDWYQDSGDYFKVGFHGGFSYSYLLGRRLNNEKIENVEDLRNFDVMALLGVHYSFTEKWTLLIRYSNSFIRIYQNPNDPDIRGWVNYHWTVRADYRF